MNITEICTHLKMSPLVRKSDGTEDSIEILDLLEKRADEALACLPYGPDSDSERSAITIAKSVAKKALKDKHDLTHLIDSKEDFLGVLSAIPLDEIRSLMFHLLDKAPREKTMMDYVPRFGVIEKYSITTFISQNMIPGGGSWLLQLCSGVGASYTFFNLASKFSNHIFNPGAHPESELDRLISDKDALKEFLKELSDIRLWQMLAVFRKTKNYEETAMKCLSENSSEPLKKPFSINTVSSFVSEKFSRKNYQKQTEILRDSLQLNLLESELYKFAMHQNSERVLGFSLVLMMALENIHFFNLASRSDVAGIHWKTQLEFHNKTALFSKCIKMAQDEMFKLLTPKNRIEFKSILSKYLPHHFQAYLATALFSEFNDNVVNLLPDTFVHYYLNYSKKDCAIKDKDEEAALLRIARSTNLLADEENSSSSDDETFFDACSPPVSSLKEGDENEYVVVDSECDLYPILKLSPEQLTSLKDELNIFLKNFGAWYDSQVKSANLCNEMAYFARCHCSLESLDLARKESRYALAGISVVIYHICLMRGSPSRLEELSGILKKYGLIVTSSQDTRDNIEQCLEDGLWPVLVSSLFRAHSNLLPYQENIKINETNSVSSFSFLLNRIYRNALDKGVMASVANAAENTAKIAQSAYQYAEQSIFRLQQTNTEQTDVSSALVVVPK